MKIKMKKIVLVLFVLCTFEAHAQSLGGEIVRKKEKPTLRSAWSANDVHTKFVYKRTDKRLNVPDVDYNSYSEALKVEADKGNVSAQYALSNVYAKGLGTVENETLALQYLKMAVDKKYPDAMCTWGIILQMDDVGVKTNKEEGHNYIKMAADNGCKKAYFVVGRDFYLGVGTPINYTLARVYWEKAAEEDNSYALYWLGAIYDMGQNVQKNPVKAFDYFMRSAMLKNADAQVMVGKYYLYGRGVAKNEKKAFEWFTHSANNGSLEGNHWLAVCYNDGLGVERNPKEAFKRYCLSADQGFAESQVNLGIHYICGDDVAPKDVKKAVGYFISSANQGNALAQYCLGECYLDGSVGEVDKYKAKVWFQKAAAQGEQHAIEALNNLK